MSPHPLSPRHLTSTGRGIRSTDHSSSGRGYRGLNASGKGGGLRRCLDTSGNASPTTADAGERRDPVVQIDIVFMDYNMPRMVRIITFPSILVSIVFAGCL